MTTSRTPTRPAFREPGYLRYLGGQAMSQIGDQVWYIALSWSAVRLASPEVAGLLVTLSSLPRLFLMLFGGVVADRHDVRRLMVGSDALRAVVTLVAAGLALRHPGIWLLAVLALVFGTVDAVFLPAAGAMQPRLLRPDQYPGGAVLLNLTTRLAMTVGAPLGGIVVAWGGLPLACVVDAATFVMSVAALATIRARTQAPPPATTRTTYWSDFRAGLRYLGRHPVLGPLAFVTLVVNFGFVGPMNIGIALLSERRDWGASGIGLLLSGFAVGAVVGGVVMLRLRFPRPGIAVAVLSVVQGLAVFGVALAPNVTVGVVATVATGLTSAPVEVISTVLTQSLSEDRFRGRVTSTLTLAMLGVAPISMAVMGFVVAAVGITGAFAISGATEILGVVALLSRGFRRTRTTSAAADSALGSDPVYTEA